MGSKRIVTASLAALALAAASSGAILPAAAAAKKKAEQKDPSRRVCRNIVTVGTRLATRVCRTQQQWDDAMRKAQDGVLDSQMGPGTTYSQTPFPGTPN